MFWIYSGQVFSSLAPLLSVYFLMAHIAQVLSLRLCALIALRNINWMLQTAEAWFLGLNWHPSLKLSVLNSVLHLYFLRVSYEIHIFFHASLSVFIYMLVCQHVSCSVLLIRIKQMVSINLNVLFISFSDVVLACNALCLVISLYRQAINHSFFILKAEEHPL